MTSLDARDTLGLEARESPKREGRMSLFLAMPLLVATGIYNPQVMHHGRCIAEPGTVDALYCVQAQAPAAPAHHHRHAKA